MEQSIGLSGLCPIQPRFNRIEAGLPRTKASLPSQNSSSTFNLQTFKHYYKPDSNLSKLIQTVFKLTSRTACPNSRRKEKITRLHTLRKWTPCLAQGLVSLRRVTANWGRIPLHGPAKRNRSWPCRVVRGVLEGYTCKWY
jgi:hypothetical protein